MVLRHAQQFRRSAWIILLLIVWAAFAQPAAAAKNVILMIVDGGGWNTWIATSMYQGKLGKQVYDREGWVRMACATYPLNLSKKPKGTGTQDRTLVYQPAKAWDSTAEWEIPSLLDTEGEDAAPVPRLPLGKVKTFAGYIYLKAAGTDSAAAGTALAAGVKTYNSAINWSDRGQTLRGQTIAELAHAAGKGVGVVTTVQWSHATPACLGGAHHQSRSQYAEIANEMLAAPYLDVLMGAGHPHCNDDGKPRATKPDYRYVGGAATWEQLLDGTHPGRWKLVQSKAEFEALTKGPTPPKVLGTAQVATTLQQRRGRTAAAAAKPAASAAAQPPASETAEKSPQRLRPPPEKPFTRPFNANVPTLEGMVKAAINCLDENPRGFYLGIEGGAVDWANHANQPGRMIEEQLDFLKAVEAVVEWVEAHSNWNETLLILTADHETGLLWGPNSDVVAFTALEDRGAGNLPGLRYNTIRHTNSLVPLFARGAGAEQLARLVVGTDKTAAARWGISGGYVDNTSVFTVMKAACR